MAPTVANWSRAEFIDHNMAKLVSGIADTALNPKQAAEETVRLMKEIIFDKSSDDI